MLNFLVLDFFYKKSEKYQNYYGHDMLHKLKTEITNNDFFALIMVETGLCDKILKVEKAGFNMNFQEYINQTRAMLKRT